MPVMVPTSPAPMRSTLRALRLTLSAATLGNIVGGAVLIALGYWFIYAKKSEA